jgi:multicomponent Na+:H+ antiporter subunit D
VAVARAAAGLPGVPAVGGEPVTWHLSGVLSGAATTVVALAAALVVVHVAPGRRGAWPVVRRALDRVTVGLERLHSGHVGDYVAWLLLGVTALGAGLLLPTLG